MHTVKHCAQYCLQLRNFLCAVQFSLLIFCSICYNIKLVFIRMLEETMSDIHDDVIYYKYQNALPIFFCYIISTNCLTNVLCFRLNVKHTSLGSHWNGIHLFAMFYGCPLHKTPITKDQIWRRCQDNEIVVAVT